jgi:hypothetical protein
VELTGPWLVQKLFKVMAELVNRTRHCHYHFAGVETEQKFHFASRTPKEQQALSVVIDFLRQLRQLAFAVDDSIGVNIAVQHTDL